MGLVLRFCEKFTFGTEISVKRPNRYRKVCKNVTDQTRDKFWGINSTEIGRNGTEILHVSSTDNVKYMKSCTKWDFVLNHQY